MKMGRIFFSEDGADFCEYLADFFSENGADFFCEDGADFCEYLADFF